MLAITNLERIAQAAVANAAKLCPGMRQFVLLGVKNGETVVTLKLSRRTAGGAWQAGSPVYAAGAKRPSTGLVGVMQGLAGLREATRMRDLESSSVTFSGAGDKEHLILCNKDTKQARVASLTLQCPLSDALRLDKRCEWVSAGWSHFAPNQCKALNTGDYYDARLAIEDLSGKQWTPRIYGGSSKPSDFDNKSDASEAIAAEFYCGSERGNFSFRAPQAAGAARKGRGCNTNIPFTVYVRTNSKVRLTVRF